MEIPDLKTYEDGRKPVKELYNSFMELKKNRWVLDKITKSKGIYQGKKISLPIIALKSPNNGKAVWIISGVHGEEPAGPNAIASEKVIKYLKELANAIPIVLLPLINPLGYLRNWRYINQEKWNRDSIGLSSGDSEHYLPKQENPYFPRKEKPSCNESKKLTKYILKTIKKYPPLISLDLHEDNLISRGYIYSQGISGADDPIAKKIVDILLNSGIKIQTSGKTRFDEKIIKGIIGNEKDSSIDEFLSTEKIVIKNKIKYKPSAKTAIIIETPAKTMELDKRIYAHQMILTSIAKFLKV